VAEPPHVDEVRTPLGTVALHVTSDLDPDGVWCYLATAGRPTRLLIASGGDCGCP